MLLRPAPYLCQELTRPIPTKNGGMLRTSQPGTRDDGTIKSAEGYDPASGMWCESVPDLTALVPARSTKADAVSALRLIRETFKTFCFRTALAACQTRKWRLGPERWALIRRILPRN
jgi:hypothetical protein